MVNTRRKGNEKELEYKKIKEAQGYSCYKSPNVKFYSVDIFGLFDLICMNEKEVLLVQVKCAKYMKGINKLRAFTNHPKEIKKVLAIWDGKKWREKNL